MIDREKVIKAIDNCVHNGVCLNCEYDEHIACKTCLMADALALLKEQDAEISKISSAYLDLVGKASKQPEIVRCKDCVYWQDNNDGYPHIVCKWREDETPDPDDYCSAGERKEGR